MPFIRNIPQDIPRFGGLVAGLGFLVFGLAATIAESTSGRPSSTAALGLIAVPIWSVFFGALGNVAGRLIGAWLYREQLDRASSESIKNTLNSVLVFVLFGAAGAGLWTARQAEENAKPEILIDTGMFVRNADPDYSKRVRTALEIFTFDKEARAISWGRNLSLPNVGKTAVRISDQDSRRHASIPITGLDYVTRIDAALVNAPGSHDPMLALVIDGRATGFRAIAAVLDSEYRVIFAERLKRPWSLTESGVEIRRDVGTNAEFIVIGPTSDIPIRLSVRRGSQRNR